MSPRERRIENLARKVKELYRREQILARGLNRMRVALYRWILMLYWKFLKDDVKVRAESLAFLMIFSFLPLFAGLFFIFTLFTKFGYVQESLTNFMNLTLSTFPPDQRVMLQDFALGFKDSYMNNIMNKSGSLGIFAVLFLVWIGVQTYDNIDRLLNFIWSSERERPTLERIRNLVVVAFVAPFVVIASLSVPLILLKIPSTRFLFQQVPLLRSLINFVTPLLLIFGTFTTLYRYGPVRKVTWGASLKGGAFAACALLLANWALTIYFRFGTTSIYGKAAIVPLFCFWIYIVWIVIILGAELSYLIQNKKYLTQAGDKSPTFFETECLLAIVLFAYEAHREARPPLTFDQFFEYTLIEGSALRELIDYLERKQILIAVARTKTNRDTAYILARDVGNLSVGEILKNYVLENSPRVLQSAVSDDFHAALNRFVGSFSTHSISSYSRAVPSAVLPHGVVSS